MVQLVLRVGVGFLTALFLCAPPVALFATADNSASQDYLVKVWGADEGLTEGSVTDVAQTPEGYLWVGTLFGSVLRFDGVRFVSYNSANTPEFSQKWGVPRLMVDRGGTLWIRMLDGGMTTWDKAGFRLRQQGDRRQALHQHRDRHLALTPHLRQAPRPLPHPGGVEVPGSAQGPVGSIRARHCAGVPRSTRPPLECIRLTRHARFPVSDPLLPAGLGRNPHHGQGPGRVHLGTTAIQSAETRNPKPETRNKSQAPSRECPKPLPCWRL